MSNIAILGDTSHDFNYEIAAEFGVEMIPYYLQMGENHFKDSVDIDSRTFYSTVDQYDVLSTGVPPAQDVLDLFDQLSERGVTDAIAICSSPKLTGMAGLYKSISEMRDDIKIHTFDTKQVGSSSGLYAIVAAELRDQGKTVDEIMERLNDLDGESQIFAIFRDLSYLVKGGRLSKTKAAVGAFLNISPVLTIIDGEIQIIEKVRGTKKSLQRLADAVKEKIGQSSNYKLMLFKGANEDEFINFKEMLSEQIEKAEMYYETLLSPVLGVHSGPKVVGASVLALD